MKQLLKFTFDYYSKFIFNSILIFVLFFSGYSFSQNLYSIEGKIVDSKTSEPLEFVSVFLAQTTIGATTNEKGVYKIGKIPKGKFVLVASMVGYESKVVAVDLTNVQNKVVNFSLERSVYEFKQIEVRDEIPTKWRDQLEIFKKQIFGNNVYARKCEIINPYQIDFKEEGSRLTAAASQPIIIQNKALGYKIECVLKSFIYDVNDKTVSYQIFPSFTEMTTSTTDSAEEYLSNRKDAFLGSMAQLLSLLAIDNYKFREAGFELSVSKQLVNKANEIVQADSVTGQYFLKLRDCLEIKYWNFGKRTASKLCPMMGLIQFDPSGFLMYPYEFSINGAMASEGVATMLPRFWKLPEEN